jgi:Holliday junction resolvase
MNSKQKGKRGELELVRALKGHGFETRRSVQYNGKSEEGQADLLGLPNIHIECKRVEKLNIYDAIAQAKHDATGGELPTVFHRKNNCKWLVTMELDDWIKLYREYFCEVANNG